MHFFLFIAFILIFGIALKRHLKLTVLDPWPQNKYYIFYILGPIAAAMIATIIVMELVDLVLSFWNG